MNNEDSKLEKWFKRTQIAANIFICLQIILVGIAFCSYLDSKDSNKKQIDIATNSECTKNAIEAINRIFNNEFLNSFAKLHKNSSLIDEETRNAFNIVLNQYYIVAVIYKSEMADNNLIEESIRDGIKTFTGYNLYLSIDTVNEFKALYFEKKAIEDMKNSFKLKMK